MNTLSTSCEQVMNNTESRARVDCRQSGFINKPISRQSTGAGARVKESEKELRIGEWGPLVKDPEAYYKALCRKKGRSPKPRKSQRKKVEKSLLQSDTKMQINI